VVFNSDVFLFGFLPVVFALFWLARTRNQRYALLAVSGYVFYGYWDWRFCFLLLFSSLVSFTAGLMIQRSMAAGARRAWMVASVAVDLAILGFFKYYNFFAGNLHAVFPGVAPPLLDIVLPIGISFYTFHTISYIVDVACGRIKATDNLFEYLAYVSLFSQLVAGPIVRFREIEEDLERIDGPPREDHMARGLGFFVVGLIKKVIVADSVAGYIDPMLASPAGLSVAGAWAAALGYTFQLYYDFSGYSDMAVGLGYLFGLRIPQNFNAPYRALGISDFWRRWHISLSSWLRDYLYIPLGGNRRGPTRTYVNLMVTMVLGGLWHGANWTFVLWGAFHGLLLALERPLKPWLARLPALGYRWLTFLLVVVSWVLFRSDSVAMATDWLGKMVGINAGTDGPAAGLLLLVAACFLAVNLLPETWDVRFGVRRRWAVVYSLGFFVAYLFMNGKKSVFLYYQF
jgi:alginate O-acetyltransferase complex protein AlgI